MKNTRFTRGAMLGATAAALAVPRALGAQTTTTLAVAGVPEDSITPVLYGVQSGLFRRNGLEVQLSPERSGPAITAGLPAERIRSKASITPDPRACQRFTVRDRRAG